MTLPEDIDRGDETHIPDHRKLHRRSNQFVYAHEYDSIQAAINAADGRKVYVRPGHYPITETIQMVSGVDVELSRQAVLDLQRGYNIDVISMRPACILSGGQVRTNRVDDYSQAAIYFDGQYQFRWDQVTGVKDVAMLGRYQDVQGAGVRLEAHTTSGDHISSVFVKDCVIRWYRQAVDLIARDETCWASGNLFDGLKVTACENVISLTALDEGAAISGNRFVNFFHQSAYDTPAAIDQAGIMMSGAVKRNWIDAFSQFDWAVTDGDRPFIKLDEETENNYIRVGGGVFDRHIVDHGTANDIVNLRSL